MGRIEDCFTALRARNRLGLIAYLVAGYPDLATTQALAFTMVQSGVDVIELGIPFSDPLADGVTIQRASLQALRQGVTLGECLEMAKLLREGGLAAPIVLMGYYNPFLSFGLKALCEQCINAGVDGIIVPDLPPEEARPLQEACLAHGLDLIFFIAPTSSKERIAKICQMAQGFIYCVSLTGVTGAREQLPQGLGDFLGQVRKYTDLPLSVGFGVSRAEHLASLTGLADAVVVGSALVDVIENSSPEQIPNRVADFLHHLRANV